MPRSTLSGPQQLQTILSAAADSVAESSLLDFKMASIASTAGVSMGTVYKHVPSKEDVLVALAVESFQHLHQVYSQIFELPFTTPERLLALFLASPDKVNRFEFSTHLEMMVTNKAVLDRASLLWRDRMLQSDMAIDGLFQSLIANAQRDGELEEEPDDSTGDYVAEMMTGMWSLMSGFQWVSYQKQTRPADVYGATEENPLASDDPIVLCAMRLLNSYPWQTKLTASDLERVCDVLAENGYR